MSLPVSFFVGFRIDCSNEKVCCDRVIRINLVYQYAADLEL